MRFGYKNIIKIALIILILATVAFIFARSLKSPEKSSAESDKVGDIVGEVIPPETKPGEFVQINLRKIAHFVEFAVLGIEVALYVSLFARKKAFMLASYPFGLFVALLDETVQIYSGRGSSVSDVWLDFLGFLTFATLAYAITLLVAFLRKDLVK